MYRFLLFIVLLLVVISPNFVDANSFEHLAGKIVLQVEKNGEAWYIAPNNSGRFFLGRPKDAFSLMREQGIGITNKDLEKIPIATDFLHGVDSDGDGLIDEVEKSLGTNYLAIDSDQDGYSDFEELKSNHNPNGTGFLNINYAFTSKNLGKIFLQVEASGQAWYVFPGDGKRYYLGRPKDAFGIMRNLGLGISNSDLEKITALNINFNLENFEKKVHDLVNKEREKFNLQPLKLNKELSKVARRHSQNLAQENKNFTGLDALCSYPLIHHEGLTFGLYQNNRLANSGIKYYNMSGENIALLSAAKVSLTYQEGSLDPEEFQKCSNQQNKWDSDFKEKIEADIKDKDKIQILKDEIEKRKKAFSVTRHLKIGTTDWQDEDELASRAVEGWMNSPGHRANILKEEYNEAGMGVAYVNSYVVITQVFIKKVSCGYEGATCCEDGKYLLCYEPNTCVDNICQP